MTRHSLADTMLENLNELYVQHGMNGIFHINDLFKALMIRYPEISSRRHELNSIMMRYFFDKKKEMEGLPLIPDE